MQQFKSNIISDKLLPNEKLNKIDRFFNFTFFVIKI